MSDIATYGFGGTNVTIYGFGPSNEPIRIIPNVGSMLGGDGFTILNTGLSAIPFRDTFPGLSLGTNWTNISSGGTATVNNGLILNVPTTGGFAGISTTSQYVNFDISTTFTFNGTIKNLFPSIGFTFLYVRAKIDTNNYFSLELVWDPTKGSVINTVLCQSGTRTILRSDSVLNTGSIFRLVRYGGRIQAWNSSSLLVDFTGWRSDNVNIEIGTQSTTTPLPLSTTVLSYIPQMLITFGNQICPNGGESFTRIIGTTPAQQLPEPVSVRVHSPIQTILLDPNLFTYIPTLQLTISPTGSKFNTYIDNDNTLRDSGADLPTLRLFDS